MFGDDDEIMAFSFGSITSLLDGSMPAGFLAEKSKTPEMGSLLA